MIMPQTIKPLGLIHKPGTGPNNRFDFINKGNNKANETKEAPPGTYFTKSGNLVKGRLTKAAKAKGARETDPKDSQRSKVPPVTQRNEARGSCWHGYQQKGLKKKGNRMVPNCVKEEAAGVGIVTKQNATKDVPVGGEYMNVKKLHLGQGKPKKMREGKHSADLKLINGKYMILQADDKESVRGLAVKSNEDGSYDTYYWYQDPDKKMPIEIEIDGKSVDKDAKVVHWKYHPELKENFADKKVKGKSRPGRVKRAGASCKGSVSSLRAKAKKYGGERGKMYHWCANMKSGRKKSK